MNNIEELKKAALGANLHGWTGFEDALNDDGYSEAVSKFIGHCRPSAILALIAQLEEAQKLKGEQVPVAVIVLSKNWPDTGRKVIDYYIEKIQHLPVGTELFTAPQKPVVLSSSTVMSRAYVVQAIKAAGFTVEGE